MARTKAWRLPSVVDGATGHVVRLAGFALRLVFFVLAPPLVEWRRGLAQVVERSAEVVESLELYTNRIHNLVGGNHI